MKFLVSILAVALFAVGCSSTSSDPVSTSAADNPKAGAEVQKTEVYRDVEITFGFPNDCCDGEFLTGVATGMVILNIDEKGSSFQKIHVSGMELTDESGRTYTQRGRGILNYIENASGYQQQVSMHFVNDDGCSFTLKFVIKLQLNANGDVTVDILDIKTICKD